MLAPRSAAEDRLPRNVFAVAKLPNGIAKVYLRISHDLEVGYAVAPDRCVRAHLANTAMAAIVQSGRGFNLDCLNFFWCGCELALWCRYDAARSDTITIEVGPGFRRLDLADLTTEADSLAGQEAQRRRALNRRLYGGRR